MSDQPTTRIIGPTTAPDLQNILNANNANSSANLHCAKIGTIQSYDRIFNTAEVSINGKVELTDGRTFDYPLLTDVPVFKITGGSAFLSMPIEAGDTCLVVFNDFDIDNWWYSSFAGSLPASNRKHSLADGMVFVGFNSRLGGTIGLSGVAELYAGENLLALGNAVTSLKGLIDGLIDVLKGLTVETGATPYPLTTVSIAALEAEKAVFATLLDQGTSPT